MREGEKDRRRAGDGPALEFCLGSTVLSVLIWQSCTGNPVLAVLYLQSRHDNPVLHACSVLLVPIALSRSGCPVLAVLFSLSWVSFPFYSALTDYPSSPVLAGLSWQPWSGSPVLAVTFWKSYHGILFCLFFSACPSLVVPFGLHCSNCLFLAVLLF